MALRFHILTLFPEVFEPFLQSSLIGKAVESGRVSFELIQIRNFATDKHRRVDDSPYGGGEGMLMKVDVLYEAWRSVRSRCSAQTRTLLLSPQGKPFEQGDAIKFAETEEDLILVCGHYEGVDERFIELCVDQEVSLGDFVLTGGEVPAMALLDAVTRVIPGVVGNPESIQKDSFEGGLLKHPQYTRPEEFQGKRVPPILLSGNHAEIENWKREQSLAVTRQKRPDLLDQK